MHIKMVLSCHNFLFIQYKRNNAFFLYTVSYIKRVTVSEATRQTIIFITKYFLNTLEHQSSDQGSFWISSVIYSTMVYVAAMIKN